MRLSVLLSALLLVTLCAASPAAAADTVHARVMSKQQYRSPPISPHFIGFSLEWDIAWTWTGLNHTRDSFITLMAQLSFSPNDGGPLFRIGGNSADYSLYNPTHAPLPNATSGFAYTWSIDDDQLRALHRGAEAVSGQLVLGLNFRNTTNNASWAVAHARAIERIIGWDSPALKGLEIGNEPDLYSVCPSLGRRPSLDRVLALLRCGVPPLTRALDCCAALVGAGQRQPRQDVHAASVLRGLQHVRQRPAARAADAAQALLPRRHLLLRGGLVRGHRGLHQALHGRAVGRRRAPLSGNTACPAPLPCWLPSDPQ